MIARAFLVRHDPEEGCDSPVLTELVSSRHAWGVFFSLLLPRQCLHGSDCGSPREIDVDMCVCSVLVLWSGVINNVVHSTGLRVLLMAHAS
jgi:hypothetical protein